MPTDAPPGDVPSPPRARADDMPKAYDPQQQESRLTQKWLASGAFHADPSRVTSGEKRPYCVLIPPPNVTAQLHLGHALNNSLQDILVRAHRMKGFETVWLPGTDHAGIATQTVVDKRLKSDGKKALADYKKQELEDGTGREAFVAEVRAFKDEYERRITEQLIAMGCSCDWDRQRFTMDPVCARAVREGFFRLFKDGLIYRGKRLVNWDPVTLTALADDEVEMQEVDGAFYYLRYPLVRPSTNPDDPMDAEEVTWSELAARGYPGADKQPEDRNAWVTVATTRPETYLGDTAVAVNPADPRAKALQGLMVQLPLVGRIIPIIEDNYVVLPVELGGDENDAKAKMATGFLKVTPAHDPNDWEIGQRHAEDIAARCSAGEHVINVMAPDASISADHGWSDYDRRSGAHVFIGKSREDARKLVVKEFKARSVPNSSEPLLEKVTPHRHSVGHSYRSHVPIEPYLSDQWYCKVTDDRLRGEAQRALDASQRTEPSLASWAESKPSSAGTSDQLADGSMTFHPARYAKTYEGWHDNLRDWCISRQLWWGHQIPVWSLTLDDPDPVSDPELTWGWYFTTLGLDHACEGIPGVSIRIADLQSGHTLRHDDIVSLKESQDRYEPGRYVVFLCMTSEHYISYFEERGFIQDPDVLDTWFSSALWPLSTMGWPDPSDPPEMTPSVSAIDGEEPDAIKQIFTRRVGTFHDFIGTEGERSAELIERLLHLRDIDPARPLKYQLFHASDLSRPLVEPEEIQKADDLICAVGVRRADEFRTQKFGVMDIPAWLRSHGFRPADDFTSLMDAFNPTNVLCTAREIITLWVSRMAMFNRYFLASEDGSGPPPFRDVFIHAMIQDGEGRKMSKSLGNGVDPLDIIHSHGADAMRYTLCHMTTHTQDVRMPVEPDPKTGRNTSPKFDLGRNFCNKLWNAARFTISMLTKDDATDGAAERSLADRWILSRLSETSSAIDDALANYEFSVYANLVYDLLWRDFCDWYLEAVKPTISSDAGQRATLRATLDAIIRMLHPITPFVTEAIHEQLAMVHAKPVDGVTLPPSERSDLLCGAGWPAIDTALRDTKAESDFERVRAIVGAIREVRAKHNVHPRRQITLHAPAAMLAEVDAIQGSELVRSLAGVETITSDAPPTQHVEVTIETSRVSLSNLADAVDEAAESERLGKQAEELRKSIAALEGRLNNPGYTEKAPAKLVEQTRQQLADKQAELESVTAAMGGGE